MSGSAVVVLRAGLEIVVRGGQISAAMLHLLIFLVTLSVRALGAIFRTREELVIENLALRQQVTAMKKERARPVLDDIDRAFWVALRASLAGLDEPIGHCHSGHCGEVESGSIPALLGEDLTAETRPWTAASRRGDSSPDPHDGTRCAL